VSLADIPRCSLMRPLSGSVLRASETMLDSYPNTAPLVHQECARGQRSKAQQNPWAAPAPRSQKPVRFGYRFPVAIVRLQRPPADSPDAGKRSLTLSPYFCKYRNMPSVQAAKPPDKIAKLADMLSAMGSEPRLRIMQLLLSAHPDGLVVTEIQDELEIPNSTLSHHLEKLKGEDLVRVQRERTFLRYTANTDALQELLQFLYAECCTRNKAVKPEQVVRICK
jgi:ArsR family transcriptional regulator, arsenate/arsenite/antimonite-responsive transcriptional repressor